MMEGKFRVLKFLISKDALPLNGGQEERQHDFSFQPASWKLLLHVGLLH
jgi:hypothetical protein